MRANTSHGRLRCHVTLAATRRGTHRRQFLPPEAGAVGAPTI